MVCVCCYTLDCRVPKKLVAYACVVVICNCGLQLSWYTALLGHIYIFGVYILFQPGYGNFNVGCESGIEYQQMPASKLPHGMRLDTRQSTPRVPNRLDWSLQVPPSTG